MAGAISKVIAGVIGVIILLIVVMQLGGETIDDIQTAGNTINTTGAPLSGLFASDSIVPLIFLAALLLVVVVAAFGITRYLNE